MSAESAAQAKLDPKNRARYAVFHNAVVNCTRAYNEEPTAARLRDLRAAEQALEDLKSSISGGASSPAETFKNRLAAWEYLHLGGWHISRTQFYQHCKAGLVTREKNGKYLRESLDKYANGYCRRVDTGEKAGATTAEKKAEIDLLRSEVRLQKERRELELIEGKSIPRAEVELMIVGRAVAMLSHLKAMTQMRASDWIHIVDGDQSRAAELIAEIQDGIEEYLATFARDVEFKVILAPAGDAPAAQSDDLDDSDE